MRERELDVIGRITMLALAVLFAVLYTVVSRDPDYYARRGQLWPRLIVGLTGAFSGAVGTWMFLGTVEDPGKVFGMGFVTGPMLWALAAVCLVVALFFPRDAVAGFLRYLFRMKWSDKL